MSGRTGLATGFDNTPADCCAPREVAMSKNAPRAAMGVRIIRWVGVLGFTGESERWVGGDVRYEPLSSARLVVASLSALVSMFLISAGTPSFSALSAAKMNSSKSRTAGSRNSG